MLFLRRNWVNVWQMAYVLLATSWLFAPFANDTVSGRTTSISQFLIPGMPYAWLFRACEFITAVLLLLAVAQLYLKARHVTLPIVLLGIFGFGLLFDLAVPTTCVIVEGACQQLVSGQAIVHAVESAVAFGALFTLALWDAWKNKRLASQVFLVTQTIVGLLQISGWARAHDISTLLQFFNQGCAVIWIAWFISTELQGKHRAYKLRQSRVNAVLAVWVALQGLMTIVIGGGYFELFNGKYAQSQAILFASHGAVVGIAFLYISRQLWRGERRAWQLLMVLVGLEIIKYAVLLPQPVLLAIYLVVFVSVLVCKDFFNRGIVHQSRRSNLYDVAVICSVVVVGAAVAAFLLSYSGSPAPASAFPRLAAAFVITAGWFVLWALFRPASATGQQATAKEIERAQAILEGASNSTEDFFKLWPLGKEYFWSPKGDGFVAYKVVGPVAFALADPVAQSGAARRRLLDQFLGFCREHDWRACFLLADEDSLGLYKKAGLGTMRIGASAVVDVNRFVTETARNKWWRWQRNKGRRMNYQYELAEPPHAYPLMQSLREVSDGWLLRGGHQEESFALGYFNTEYLQRCRIHLLRNETGKVVAFVNEIPLFGESKQTTIDLIRFTDDAPNANNFLIYSLLHRLEEEGRYQFFDIGFVPLARMDSKAVKVARKLGANRFSAAGLEQFKNKFEPNWRKDYIAYDGNVGDLPIIGLHLEESMAVDERDLGK